MGRIQSFEFGDQSWFPRFLRDYQTDFLQFLANKAKMYKPIVPLLLQTLEKTAHHQIIDIASGGGGSLLWLNEELRKSIPKLKILLTDFYPNLDAFRYTQAQASNIDFLEKPVDARAVPSDLKGLRTQFLSFHHFKPQDAQQILQNAVDTNSPIAIFEAQERSFPSLLAMFFSPLTVLLTTPFIRPFKWGRLLFTYLIPLVPLSAWWDGIISALRTYSVAEMQVLVNKLENKERFDWTIERIQDGPGVILCLIATPKVKAKPTTN